MKKNNLSLLWNPFRKIAGWKAFVLGVVIVVVTSVIGHYSNTSLDGFIDAHLLPVSMKTSLLYGLINILSIVVVITAAGLIGKKHFRLIDVLGTLTLARYPYLFVALFGFLVSLPSSDKIIANPQIILSSPIFYLVVFILTVFVIWFVALVYHAIKTSLNLKGKNLTLTVIMGILIAEILSKILIVNLL